MAGYYRHVRRRLSPAAIALSAGALAMFMSASSAVAQTPAVRVGLADVAATPAGHAAVATLRARLEPRPGIALPRDAARAALEEPLPTDADGAGGPATRPRAAQLVRAARDAYSRFDYDGALERLRQAELALATAPPVADVTRLLVDVNLLAGVVQADRGDTAHALEAFGVVRRLDPERTALDPGSYRPRVVALYAQAAAVEARRARLDVVTDPAGAEVWIDGRRAGTSPLSATLEAGPHYVGAVAEGNAPRLERPVLRAGQDSRLSLLLSRSPPEERAQKARADLLAGRLGWDRGPAALAAAASLDLVVLVRDGGDGPEAAVYDARAGALGVFMPAAPVEPVLVALATALAAPPAPVASLVGGKGRERDAPPPAAAPWYRSWWLAPPLLAVGAAVALGTLWIIDRERTTTYAINRWCFNNTCSP
jgi:PEGA domain